MNRTLQSALAILLILGLSFAVWHFVVAVEADPPRAMVRDLGPIPVRTVRLERSPRVPTVEVFGSLEARRRALVSSKVGARIESVHEDWAPGVVVSEGQVLVLLDPVDFELELRAGKARLAEARAGLRRAHVRAKAAQVSEAKARELLEVSRREYERLSSLEGEGAESQSRLDRSLGERLDAELSLETAILELESTAAAVETAEAAVEVALAAVAVSEENLEECTVRAAIGGRLVGPRPGIGTTVQPGLSLGELVDPESLVLAARVPERELLRIPIGAEATIELPSLDESGIGIRARVDAIDAASDGLVRHGRVEIEPLDGELGAGAGEGKPRFLPVGLFGRAEVQLEPRNSVHVERRHLVWDGEEASCFVARAGPEGALTAERVALRLGAPHGEGFLVEAGLVDGDELIVHPLERLHDGARIQLRAAQDSPR